jgi:hypothetical protein
MNAEVAELLREVRSYGFATVIRPSGHYHLYHGGRHIVDAAGPVTIPSTPSDNRWQANTVARLRRARVLPDTKVERPERVRRPRPAKVSFTFEDAIALWSAREAMVEATGTSFPLVDDLIAKIEQAAGVVYDSS